MTRRLALADLDGMDRDAFAEALADIFEHSPWVGKRAWERRPFADTDGLHAVMSEIADAASAEEKLALIRAHPDLAGQAAVRGELTRSSRNEQAGAGLEQCTQAEFQRFQELNTRYRDKFGFPFVIAVKGLDRQAILAALASRLDNDGDAESAEALAQIAKIAHFRLSDLLGPHDDR